MAVPVTLHYGSAPALAPAYLRILLTRKPSHVVESLPRIEGVLERAVVNPSQLARFRTVCAVTDTSCLPITYPHVMAAPLHLAMISSRDFPVNLLGVVHLRNRIVQHRPLQADEVGEIRAWLEGHRETLRGQELDLHTQLRVTGAIVWSETSTFLMRRAVRNPGSRARDPAVPKMQIPPREAVISRPFSVAPSVGHRYARVSGDYNPIHIADAAARLFGLPHAIAHGMWSLARCAAETGAARLAGPCMLDVAFRRPVAFGARMALESWFTEYSTGFSLRECDADRELLLGSLTAA